MPGFGGGMGGGFENFAFDAETRELEIGDAHISLEIEGGKATGSMEDIQPGAFVTVTLNSKGKVTNMLVSPQSFSFVGGRNVEN